MYPFAVNSGRCAFQNKSRKTMAWAQETESKPGKRGRKFTE